MRIPKHWGRWLAGAIAVLALVVVGGPYLYLHYIEGPAPAKLKLSANKPTQTTKTSGATATIDGTWKVSKGSQAGYRVDEVLFGQSHAAVGRTDDVSGTLMIAGTSVTEGSFTVDLMTVTSDEDRRDRQFQGRIMNTAEFPDAKFVLTSPVDLESIPADGTTISPTATGRLTMHGVAHTVEVPLEARRNGDTIEVSGEIAVTFADYEIGDPSFVGLVTTEDNGTIEFLLNFTRTKPEP